MTKLRAVLGLGGGAIVAIVGALILGEYEFTGLLPFAAGPLFGLAVAEVVVGVGRDRSTVVALGAAALAFGGVAWAGWIDSTEGVEPMKGLAWVAAALAAVVAGARTIERARLRGAPVTTSRR
ncbi:MAG: hypothetical protein ACT4OV_08765 [Microthrixaceae bacterium]